MLKKTIDIGPENVVVTLTGNLYMEEAAGLRMQLLQLFSEGNERFVIKLAGLENMDTTGLGVFISLYKRTKGVKGNVIICGLQGNVKELFLLTQMDQVFVLQD